MLVILARARSLAVANDIVSITGIPSSIRGQTVFACDERKRRPKPYTLTPQP